MISIPDAISDIEYRISRMSMEEKESARVGDSHFLPYGIFDWELSFNERSLYMAYMKLMSITASAKELAELSGFSKVTVYNTKKSLIEKGVLPQKENAPARLYMISDGRYTKIGVSKNVKTRIKELQTGNPNKLKILVKSNLTPDAYDQESMMHRSLKKYRLIGEWFDLNEGQIEMAKDMIEGLR